MSLINNGITSVRAFSLPCGIWPDGGCADMPQVVLVKWKSVLKDVLYQVYVNGQFAGSTICFGQKEMMVHVPPSFTSAARIEVFAVQPENVDIDFSSELDNPFNGGRLKIRLSRSQDLPVGATAFICFDNGTGQIDYEKPVGETVINIWPSWQDKSGFGMSRFGFSDFGYDSSAAVGFGKGCFGKDGFGIDADMIEWISPILQTGVYKFAAVIFDNKGNKSSATETGPITVIPEAQPAKKIEILSYDKESNELVLNVT
ncbi:MAG: hypothetical protein P8016_14330 [Sedimentisphaerales bacterium]